MESQRKRVFIGLMADTGVQRALLRHQLSWSWPAGARLTPAAKMHLTLQFLGLVDEDEVEKLKYAVAAIRFQPFDLVLCRNGTFADNIAWVAPERSPSLVDLHQLVTSATREVGILANEEWTPHVTLARRSAGALQPAVNPAITWMVREVGLVLSERGTYRQISSSPAAAPVH